MGSRHLDLLICLFLIVATLAVYWRLPGHDFINFDDDLYVSENTYVTSGLTERSLVWAFTAFHAGNWHPLTWLSHMLDCELFGLRAGMHHLTNLLFHIANTLLLFLVLRRMTGAIWRSAFVAALFAFHPLHVESVAWVSERKDVLSTFFWFLTMWAYVGYAERGGVNRYLLVLIFFTLGLMAKPMVVTLPFVLLLMDYWPLGRVRLWGSIKDSGNEIRRASVLHLIWEKAPLFALVAVSCVVAFLAQQKGGAVQSLEELPITIRVSNISVAYISYIGKMIWPQGLAVFYPYPERIPLWHAVGAGVLLIVLSIVFFKPISKYPYLAVGWLWYLGTLIPVIGIVKVGSQSMADRYTYIPLIGLFIMIAWGVSDLVSRWRHGRIVLVISGSLLLSGLSVCAWLQVSPWKDSVTLFTHTLDVTDNNDLAHNNLGLALMETGRLQEAIKHYLNALQINPRYAYTHYNLGVAKATLGSFREAIKHYSDAIRIDPGLLEAHNNLGNAFLYEGRIEDAIKQYSEALRINPEYAEAHTNLGNALTYQGHVEAAITHYSEALRINPKSVETHINLGIVLENQGDFDQAIAHFEEALRIKPDFPVARRNLERALEKKGKKARGASDIQSR